MIGAAVDPPSVLTAFWREAVPLVRSESGSADVLLTHLHNSLLLWEQHLAAARTEVGTPTALDELNRGLTRLRLIHNDFGALIAVLRDLVPVTYGAGPGAITH